MPLSHAVFVRLKPLKAILLSTALCVTFTACRSDIQSSDSVISDMATAQPEPVNPVYIKTEPGPGRLTPERIHADPALDGQALRKAAISPDGTRVSVLRGRPDNANQQDLWAYDLDTGEASLLVNSTDLISGPEVLSEEEKNRRERAREYGQGIVSYSWANDNLLLFPLGGDIYTYDLIQDKAMQITATKAYETDAKVSPLGHYASYVRSNELYITDLKTGLERQITDGSTQTIRNATASFVVQEELDRDSGYWWSAKEDFIAYTQIDESSIAISNRIDFGADGVETISQRYPFAGTANATVKLGVIPKTGGETVWVDLGPDKDIYLTRVLWSQDGKNDLFAGVLSRDQKTHTFYKIDIQTGKSTVFYQERSKTWLNIGTDLKALPDGSVLWSTEALNDFLDTSGDASDEVSGNVADIRSDKAAIHSPKSRQGKRSLIKIDGTGLVTQITPKSVLVNKLNCVRPDENALYFTAWTESPLERHIYRITLEGNALVQLSEGAKAGKNGRYSADFSLNCARYIGGFNNVQTPPQSRAYKNDGTPLIWLNENALTETHPYYPFKAASIVPEFGQLTAEDGSVLEYMLYKPLDLKAGEKRPVINVVYGGPGVQRVHKGWERRHFERMLAHHGFVVFSMDNRGANNRGKAFEDSLYRAMGGVEVRDQSMAIEWLKTQDYVDPDKIGVYGWSYGGYLTLHLLGQTDLFKSGVAGAPVTDWALYDTAYTERYLGSPKTGDPNYTQGVYENGSVFAHLDGLSEPTLVIHGMADDNVVFQNTVKLMDAVQKRGLHNVRFVTYPGEKHGFRQTHNKVHRDRTILEFFTATLGP